MADKQIGSVTIRFNAPDQDLKDEFFRQLKASGSTNKSGFGKELLTRALYPEDPTQNATMQALLRDVKDATSEIRSDLTELKVKDNRMRLALANAITILLTKVARQDEEKTKRWVNRQILG